MHTQFTGSVSGHEVSVSRTGDKDGVDSVQIMQHDGKPSSVMLAVADARRMARLILAMTDEA
jgi:hypothetical protein